MESESKQKRVGRHVVASLIPLGAIVGALSGFFGIGGGVIIVPVLLFSGYSAAEAVATSLLFVVGTSLSGAKNIRRSATCPGQQASRSAWPVPPQRNFRAGSSSQSRARMTGCSIYFIWLSYLILPLRS